jgi:hypothetical protein
MSKPRKKKRTPKRALALPDLEQSKAAVLNSLTSKSGQRTYDHAISDFVDWYCSEPRLAFNRTVVLRYRSSRIVDSHTGQEEITPRKSARVSRCCRRRLTSRRFAGTATAYFAAAGAACVIVSRVE